MYEFEYCAPGSLAQARDLLAGDHDARLLAGGMSLLSAMKLRLAAPSRLVDLRRIASLQGIEARDGCIQVGAMTRHAAVAASPLVRERIPALAVLAGGIGDRQVRNRGTIGGSLANADPAACYPAGVLGLNATIVTSEREIAADDFFRGLFETALRPNEIITAVRFPIPQAAAYVKFHQAASRFALVGVLVSRWADRSVRVAVTGAKVCAFRAGAIEAALRDTGNPEAALAVRLPADDINEDLHADARYRAHLVSVIAARAAQAAWH